MKIKEFLKCPVCGRATYRRTFTLGALGRTPLQYLRQRFAGKGNGITKEGERGGAVIWDRRPMTLEEAAHVGRAVATAATRLEDYLADDLPAVARAEQVLSSVEDYSELIALSNEWIEEAEKELAFRRQLVEDEIERRRST